MLPPFVVDWGVEANRRRARLSSRKLLDCGRAHASSTHVGIRARGWQPVDERPGRPSGRGRRPRPKLVVNEPTLRSPTVKQMSATERSVLRSSAAARSSRRVSRYWCGVSPKARRNSRLKCAGERRAARASVGYVERLAVAGVDEILRAEQMPRGKERRHHVISDRPTRRKSSPSQCFRRCREVRAAGAVSDDRRRAGGRAPGDPGLDHDQIRS